MNGMSWDWETFEEYLDSVGRRSYACDVAALVGHAPLRTWVLGKRASASDRPGVDEALQPHEIQAMAQIVQDAVAAGALGFSTSRGLFHRDKDGWLTPGTLAGKNELLSIARAIANAGGGIFQWATDFSSYDDLPYAKLNPEKVWQYRQDEFEWMKQIAREHGEKVALTWTLGWGNEDPQTSRQTVEMQVGILEDVKAEGGLAKAQVFARTQGFLFSFTSRLHPFLVSETFQRTQARCKKIGRHLLADLRDPEIKASILRETQESRKSGKWAELYSVTTTWPMTYRWTAHYEPGNDDNIKVMAKRAGKAPLEIAYDIMVEEGCLWRPFSAWGTRDLSLNHELFCHPQIVPGADDAGAHYTIFADAAAPSHMLTHWVRDRTHGPTLGLEYTVRKLSREIAELFGLPDRGALLPGLKADINVVDLEKMEMQRPYFRKDLPLGAGRWLQDVSGYKLTLVSGCETVRDGVPTGAFPGRLVRNPRRQPGKWSGLSHELAGPFDTQELSAADAAEAEAQRLRALEGAGAMGTSAAARVLRDTVEDPQGGAGAVHAAPLSKL